MVKSVLSRSSAMCRAVKPQPSRPVVHSSACAAANSSGDWPAASAWDSSIQGRKSLGSRGREREAEVGEVALRVDDECGHSGRQQLFDEDHAETGLAGSGHPDDAAVGGEVVGVDAHLGARALVVGRVDVAAEEEVCHVG
jgi:hypothetical protein